MRSSLGAAAVTRLWLPADYHLSYHPQRTGDESLITPRRKTTRKKVNEINSHSGIRGWWPRCRPILVFPIAESRGVYINTHTHRAGRAPTHRAMFFPAPPEDPRARSHPSTPTSNKCPEPGAGRVLPLPTQRLPRAYSLSPSERRNVAPRPPTRRPPPQARSPTQLPTRPRGGTLRSSAAPPLTWQRAPWQRPAPALAPREVPPPPRAAPLLPQSLPPPGPSASSSHEDAPANQRLPPAPARRAPEGKAARSPRCFLGDAGGTYGGREG